MICDDTALVRKVKETISHELTHRYKPYDVATAESSPVLASLLDPRYKRLHFLTPEQRSAAATVMESLLDDLPLKPPSQNDQEVVVTDGTSPKRAKKSHDLDLLNFGSPERTSNLDELQAYMSEKKFN